MKKSKKEIAEGDVTHLIERLEAFEERMGVRLEALFAHVDEYGNLTVRGEIHPRDGATIKEDIAVEMGAYDSAGRLVARDRDYIDADKFFGFQVFGENAELPIRELSKIRVYPKPNV